MQVRICYSPRDGPEIEIQDEKEIEKKRSEGYARDKCVLEDICKKVRRRVRTIQCYKSKRVHTKRKNRSDSESKVHGRDQASDRRVGCGRCDQEWSQDDSRA